MPRSIVWDEPVSDLQLETLCAANDALQFERTKEGDIRVNPPTALTTSDGNSEINQQLRLWWKTHRRGKVADSNGGFYLKDGSMLSPDAAYLTPKALKTVPAKEMKKGFPHVCPDFVIELLSASDSLQETQQKMEDWVANGASLGWLIQPAKRRVFVYSPTETPVIVTGDSIQGSGPVEGFTLDLAEVWSCYR